MQNILIPSSTVVQFLVENYIRNLYNLQVMSVMCVVQSYLLVQSYLRLLTQSRFVAD